MSASILCPYCGHSTQPNRSPLDASVICERCQKILTPATLEPLVQPEMTFGSRSAPHVDEPNNASAFLAIFLIVGSIVLLCGGIGGYIAINARNRIVAAAKKVEEANQQRQRAMEGQLPKPETVPSSPPEPRVRVNPDIAPALEPPQRTPRPTPAGKSLDELLTELNDEQRSRPAWAPLNELSRMPLQEDRRVDVSSAIEIHLRSSDSATTHAAVRAAVVWGTDWNADSLLALIDSPHDFTRTQAIRALAKVRPTAETAELLLAQAVNVGNSMALREAFADLGPLAEQAMIDCLESDDLKLKKSMMHLLGDIGTRAAIEPLEDVIRTETDAEFKGQAEAILRRIRSRLR